MGKFVKKFSEAPAPPEQINAPQAPIKKYAKAQPKKPMKYVKKWG